MERSSVFVFDRKCSIMNVVNHIERSGISNRCSNRSLKNVDWNQGDI